jgi:hypothetical protein
MCLDFFFGLIDHLLFLGGLFLENSLTFKGGVTLLQCHLAELLHCYPFLLQADGRREAGPLYLRLMFFGWP